jgi:hypothetical protein
LNSFLKRRKKELKKKEGGKKKKKKKRRKKLFTHTPNALHKKRVIFRKRITSVGCKTYQNLILAILPCKYLNRR